MSSLTQDSEDLAHSWRPPFIMNLNKHTNKTGSVDSRVETWCWWCITQRMCAYLTAGVGHCWLVLMYPFTRSLFIRVPMKRVQHDFGPEPRMPENKPMQMNNVHGTHTLRASIRFFLFCSLFNFLLVYVRRNLTLFFLIASLLICRIVKWKKNLTCYSDVSIK